MLEENMSENCKMIRINEHPGTRLGIGDLPGMVAEKDLKLPLEERVLSKLPREDSSCPSAYRSIWD
jgi:hypothetical protein